MLFSHTQKWRNFLRPNSKRYWLTPLRTMLPSSPYGRLRGQFENVEAENYPGAGGGGAGAIGDGAVAGDGGGGGEQVSAIIDINKLKELRQRGFHHAEVVVGQAGPGPRHLGEHGRAGEDTLIKFVTRDGAVLKTIRTRGGQGGASGGASLPDGVAGLFDDDVERGGFCITTLMPANAVEVRDSLVFVLGGNWASLQVPTIPSDARLHVVCTARWRTLEGATPRGIFLSLVNPAGREASSEALVVPAQSLQGGFCSWVSTIGATLDAEGAWTLRLHSGGYLLAHFDVQVSVAPGVASGTSLEPG